jgi:transposase-like protein
MVKAGFYGKNRIQRYKCQQCGKRFAEQQEKPFGEHVRLSPEKIALILTCLVEGNSVRGTARLCDVEKRTVLHMLKLAGERCGAFLRKHVHNVRVRDWNLMRSGHTFTASKRIFDPTWNAPLKLVTPTHSSHLSAHRSWSWRGTWVVVTA